MKKNGKELLGLLQKEEADNKLREKYKHMLPLSGKVYIFGTGLLGQFVKEQLDINNISVSGFIDNNSKIQMSKIGEITVFPLGEVRKDATIIIGTIVHWHTIRRQLEEGGYQRFICYEELALCYEQFPIYNQSFQGIFRQLIENKSHYLRLYDVFRDEKSLQILDQLILFRLTMDTMYTDCAFQASINDGSQYFDSNIVQASENEIFVDGGGFKGESSEEFIAWCKGNYKKILFFELDDITMEKAKYNLESYDNIIYINRGLGKEKKTLYYTGLNQLGGGMISENGTIPVEVCALDEFEEAVSFIKMDIEGFETEALRGASQTIRKWKPKLAISVYHKPEHLYEILEYIEKLGVNYSYYLRHYTNVYADTVLYAVVENGNE